jgi:tRNA pseudouridine38-40 synthase
VPAFRITLAYDGTDFAGWQIQPGAARTVQGALERALERITGAPVRVVGAGRTDAGVHAEGQVASAELATALEPDRLRSALNAVLPQDAAAVAVSRVADDFDARRDARAKHYRYRIWNGPDRAPLLARQTHHVRRTLDLAAMTRAARDLTGTHDFASFQAAGSAVTTTERTLFACDVCGSAPGEVWLDFAGSGFLRRMVRNLAGTLIEVGSGRRDPASLPGILAARDRAAAGPTAPARGLVLRRVDY